MDSIALSWILRIHELEVSWAGVVSTDSDWFDGTALIQAVLHGKQNELNTQHERQQEAEDLLGQRLQDRVLPHDHLICVSVDGPLAALRSSPLVITETSSASSP